jgi:protease-4
MLRLFVAEMQEPNAMLDRILNINPERIAVAEFFGAIGSPDKTTAFVRMLKAVEENKRIKALVLDIDSPGGGAGASEQIHSSIKKVAGKKPVIGFVRGMAASGGYMAACACTKVVSLPMGIVGSIGVISMRPMLYDMLEKIGVRMDVTKAGRLKDMFSNFREPTDEERVKEQALLDSIYEQFVEMVATSRGLGNEVVRELAKGEIYTAEQAKEHGLIDGLGDLDAAIDMAQQLAGLAERKVTYIRPHRSLRERILAGTSTGVVDSLAWALEGRLSGPRIELR